MNCYGPDAFDHSGQCIRATALVGVSVNPLQEYIYGELSALTIGKIFRLFGSKLQIPKIIDETGFKEGLIVRKIVIMMILMMMMTMTIIMVIMVV